MRFRTRPGARLRRGSGADLATAEVLDDLIDLLADDSPAVRSAAAQALFRLTGRDQGFTLDQWQAEDAAMHEAGAEAWRRWRADSQKRSGGLAIEPERPASSVRPINAQNASG